MPGHFHERLVRNASAIVLLLAAQACVDPQARYDAFIERTADMRGRDAGPIEGGGERFDFSGRYLLALSTTLAPSMPILFGCEVDVASGLETLDLTIQPLTTEDSPTPREPIGDSLSAREVPYAEDGSFVADLGEVMVPSEANPVSGAPIVATVVIAAGVFPQNDALANHFCGQAMGMVTVPVPLDLAGSTFGAIEADDFSDTDPLPGCPE